jgi:putative transposase
MRYKGRWASRHVVFVGRFYPSSQLCYVCEYQHKDLTLADREWDCPYCGTHHLRDQTAAQNLQREGFRLLVVAGHAKTENARGADVRLGTTEPSAMKRESPGFSRGECQYTGTHTIR